MTTRDLFGSDNPQKIISNESTDELGKNVESSGNLQQRLQEKDRFIPLADFRTPSSFARYGSAEKYYTNAISRIYSDYPYDGSLKEKTEFRNESTYLDLYMLDNKYPRTTGYVTISSNGWGTQVATSSFGGSPDILGKPSIVEYIQIVGGPHTASGGMEGKSLSTTFDKSNLYDATRNRESNLKCDFDSGIAVEFWMNKPTASLMTGSTAFEMVYHLSNENSGSLACFVRTEDSADDTLPRMQVIVTTPTQLVTRTIPTITNTEMLDGKWHHYATSVQNSGSFVKFKTYYDGKLIDDATVTPFLGSTPILEITGALKMNIGASRKAIYTVSPTLNISFPDDGWCKLSGSIDEFRYWKTARSSEQIGKYWFTQFGGGTNADDSNTDLGVYYKFNEGITGISSIDSTVLDYSGRISNGVWTGYTSSARSTGSAIDLHLKKNSEFRDPIIYQVHPEVTLLTTKMVASASAYDVTNNSSIYNSVPSWITEEDEQHGGDLSKLTQIMASYFDNLHLQIEALPRLKDKIYTDPSIKKPKTFASRLLETQGFVAPELFANAGVLEQIANRDDDEKFELDLVDIKNSIYQNVYNNLINIYKSKGTTESFRNLIRCFGVDDELVRLNIYGNNVDHEIKDAYRNTTVKKKFADFNHPDRFRSTTFQQTASSNPNSVSFITASSNSSYLPFTIESEFVFPKKLSRDNPNWFDTLFLSSSLFGYHGVTAVTDSLGWPTIGSDNNVQVYAVREELESKNVYFQLRDRAGSFNLTSSIFDGVYDNQKWNLALRYIPHNTSSNLVSGSATGNATLELYGVSSDAGIINNSFNLSTPVSAAYGKTSKRLYLGSHRTNFTGSSISETDVKASSLRYWASNLNDSVIQLHARDPSNYGVTSPYQSAYLYNTQLTGVSVPQIETLALNWDFSTVTSSDGGISGVPTVSDAGFEIPDFSSGSISLSSRYKWLGEIINRQHTGRGAIYLPNDSKVVDVKYLYSGKQTAPEVIQSSDAINISDNEDIYFDRSSRPTNFYYSFEKSMYQTISDEMLNIFATITDFNNLIGDPVNRYRQNYKEMEKLRQLFFERVENTPSLDKYIEFYKWIDNSLNIMLQQLTPLSADTSDGVRTMVESHVLERNKYWSKFPSLEMEQKDPEGGAQGINKLSYNWKYGHSPIGITATSTTVGNDLLAYYRCASTADEQGSYNGTFSGVSVTATGKYGDGWLLTSTPDGVVTTTGIPVDATTTGYTLSCWVYNINNGPSAGQATSFITDNTTQMMPFYIGYGFVGSKKIFASIGGGTFQPVNLTGTGTQLIIDGTIAPYLNSWTHICVTALGNDLYYYINGALVAETSNASFNSTFSFDRIGNLYTTWFGKHTFGDRLDEVAVWGRVLTSSEISEIYNSEIHSLLNASGAGQGSENTNCWWWENRAARTGSISSGDAQVDADRQKIFNVSVSALNRSYSTPYRLHAAKEKQIKGGTNAPGPNTIEILRSAMSPGTSDGVHFVSFDDLPQCQDDSDLETPRLQPTPFASTPESEYLAAYADFASPATIFSSSIKTGYQSQFAGGTGIAMEGLHRDIYGPDSEIPAQGPFTDALVGGLQYRNVPPMTLSASRPEGWKFVLGSNSNFEYPSLHSPRATHYRDGTARRPVNIRNIKINSLGNYSKNHQVIQSSGRHVNNLAWVSSSGWDLAPLGIPSIYISGLLDTPKIDFGKNETVIVNRFSAPGGADTAGDANGGPSLDRYSAEYSPYNQLTYRNKAVRHRENRLLTSHVNQFGYFSNTGHPLPASSSVNPLNYNGTGSVYQVNRNTRRRMEMSASTVFTSSVYDNYWVNHPIPRSDLQYAWINASYESVDPSGLGYWHEGLFTYVARNNIVFEDHFSSSLNLTNWNTQSIDMRQDEYSENWVARLGSVLENNTPPMRYLESTNDYNLPFNVEYSYARGQFQNRASRFYLNFDEGSVLLSPAAPVTSTTGRATISFWFNAADIPSVGLAGLTYWNGGASHVAYKSISIHSASGGPTISFSRETTSGDLSEQFYTSEFMTGSWYHIAIAHDDSDCSVAPTTYINGVSSSYSQPPTYEPFPLAAVSTFTIGGADPQISGFPKSMFSGSMDSVSWWNDELTEAQVQELYNNGTPSSVNKVSFWPSSITTSNQVHYWQMGDARRDHINLGTPPVGDGIYDYGTIPNSFSSSLSTYGTGDLKILEYAGYGLASPDVSGQDEYMTLEVSLNSGATWSTVENLKTLASSQGDFLNKVSYVSRDFDSTDTARVRFKQENFTSKKDNWALNHIKISEISEISPVEFSPFGDFSSRYFNLGPNLKYGNPNALIATSANLDIFLPTVYTDLNYNIYEPIDPDNQYQGYPLTSQSIDYLNSTAVPDGFANNALTTDLSKATLLNAILLKRNGPYQYPNWKQIRTGEGTLATYYRNNNIITVTQQPGRNKRLGGEKYIEPFGKTHSFREPAIDSKYSPIETELGLRVETSDDSGESKFIVRPVTLASPYGNNLAYFDNPKLNKLAKFDDDSNSYIKQPYDVVKDLYLNGELGSLESPVYSFINLKYQERVYPASRNIYAKNTRERKDFSNTFWRDSRANRDALGTKKFDGKNSQGIVHAQSAWGLDGRPNLTDPAPAPPSLLTTGELQNGYTLLVKQTASPLSTPRPTSVKPAPMHTRKQDIGSLYSVVSPNGMSNINRDITSSVYVAPYEYPGHNLVNWPGSSSVGFFNGITGDAQWQAGELAGKVIDKQFVSQSSKPFYDTYDKFNEHLRLKNKDYSIIPEFRISEQMEYYHDEKGGDFLAANKNIFSIFGSPSASSGEADFFKTYSYTDFMKYFEVIDADHEDMSDLGKTLSLKCKALKKFVPYDGFYPAERTLQIASQFSSSYSSYITASGDFEYKDTPVRMRPLLQPFMAPGVLYNTIKSGIAVDYPIYTGSFARINYATGHPSGSAAWGIKTWLNDDFTEGSGAPYVKGINTDNWIFDETSDGPDLREDSGGSGNWIFRFRGTHSPDKRYLITKNSYQSPVQVTFNFARGNFQNGLTPGYDLELPAVGDDFHFEYSTNGGTSWLTQSVFQRGTTAAGTFIPHTASFPASSGTVTFRWRQVDWTGANNDNWGLDDVKIETAFTSSTYWGIGPKLSTDGTSLSENQGWDYRVPFEAILDPELVNGINFIDMEVNPQFKLSSSAAVTNIPSMTTVLSAPATKNLYKLMTSNFLAETTEFFLKQGKLSSFKSNVSDSGFEFKSGSYAMRVRMRRSMNRERKSPTPWQLPVDWYDQTNLNETITMYSKPNSFGPPVVGSGHVWSTGSMSGSTRGRQQNSDSLFGRNPSFTPPYYDGECWYDIIYTTSEDRVLPLEEFFMSASVYSLRIPTNSSAWPNNYIYLSPGVSGSFAYPNPAGVEAKYFPMNSASANNYAMKMDSSINIFSKEFVNSQVSSTGFSPRWVIQPKMETPILNFGDTTRRPLGFHNIDLPTGGDPVDQVDYDDGYFGKTTTPIGMWHQFGLIPQKDEGIHLSIEDVPQPWLESKSSIYPAAANTKSLIDVVGFKKNASRKLGKLAESKTVHEAVVAIPYIIENGQRTFFTIDRELIDNSVKKLAGEDISAPTPGNSIVDMVSGMQKYILPPRMDFVANPDIDPFAIYLFEFSHTFDQDDLSYMWQNMMPTNLGANFEEDSAIVSHKLVDRQVLETFKDRVRWVVFKAKQRGNNNYYSLIAGSTPEKSQQEKYSYNWPYDYFSLVEFVNINSEVEYSTDTAIDVNESFAEINKGLQKGVRSTKELTQAPSKAIKLSSGLSKIEAEAQKATIEREDREIRKTTGAFGTTSGSPKSVPDTED